MTPADVAAAIRALYRKGWTTAAGTPCVLVRDVERVLGELATDPECPSHQEGT